ncbi:hypothetical protein BST40_20565 [Mycobacterium persicum]|nr:hypothetical protein A4G31_19155 [Mycobacterium persicum]ORB43110.1 hypothetical protein BST40_20565 [Mycobacterium persicum]
MQDIRESRLSLDQVGVIAARGGARFDARAAGPGRHGHSAAHRAQAGRLSLPLSRFFACVADWRQLIALELCNELGDDFLYIDLVVLSQPETSFI